MKTSRTVLAGVAALAALFAAAPPGEAAVTTFSAVTINSPTSVYFDPAPDDAFDETGADLSLADAGIHDLAYNNGAGYTVKTTTDDVFAAASLASGAVKLRSSIGFGIDKSGAAVPVNHTNSGASGTATMADSFRAYSGDRPYLWTSSTEVTFEFSVTGTVDIPADLALPAVSKNIETAFLVLRVYKPGAVDIYHQLSVFDFNSYPDYATANAAYNKLNDQLQALVIGSEYWYFGDPRAPYAIDPAHVVVVNPDVPSVVQYKFMPAGDFDWILLFDMTNFLDASEQSKTASMDLSHTVGASYLGPDGATTYSASGLFPETQPVGNAPAILCGDANDDGKLTASDAAFALRAAVGSATCSLLVCDVDATGSISASDALKLLKKAVGQNLDLSCFADL